MTQLLKYPFKLKRAFFTSINISRNPNIPDRLEMDMPAQVKIVEENLPDLLQINLKLKTIGEDLPLSVNLELIGLFDLIEGQPHANRDLIVDFTNERALFMMWPYMEQTFRQLTARMGMESQTLLTPYYYEFAFSEPEGGGDEEE